MATTQSNPPARADEKTNQELYQKAAEALGALFGTPAKPGIFNGPIPDGFKSRTEFMRSILDVEGNRAYFGTMPQPHTATLATVMAARGNPLFPPDLVVEFVARPNEGDDDFDDTASRVERLGLLAEIAALTRDPATGNSRVALKLPFNGRLDFKGSVVGIFDALTVEEGKKLGLDKVETGSGFREFATDLDGVVGELAPRTLSPMQRFYLRVQQWAEQRETARVERDKRRSQHERSGDAAAALPRATPAVVPKPEPEPLKTPLAAVPDLSVLIGGSGSPQPPAASKAPRVNRKATAAAPVAPPAVVPPTAPPLVAPAPATPPATDEPKPAAPAVTTAANEDHELVLAAIESAGTPAAKAMLVLVRAGKKTVADAATWAISKGLL